MTQLFLLSMSAHGQDHQIHILLTFSGEEFQWDTDIFGNLTSLGCSEWPYELCKLI